jgi:hypothetical protein
MSEKPPKLARIHRASAGDVSPPRSGASSSSATRAAARTSTNPGSAAREAHRVELHHLKPFATGGEHRLANLALRCTAHNALAAEQDFGRDFIQRRRHSNRHESLRNQVDR